MSIAGVELQDGESYTNSGAISRGRCVIVSLNGRWAVIEQFGSFRMSKPMALARARSIADQLTATAHNATSE